MSCFARAKAAGSLRGGLKGGITPAAGCLRTPHFPGRRWKIRLNPGGPALGREQMAWGGPAPRLLPAAVLSPSPSGGRARSHRGCFYRTLIGPGPNGGGAGADGLGWVRLTMWRERTGWAGLLSGNSFRDIFSPFRLLCPAALPGPDLPPRPTPSFISCSPSPRRRFPP